MFRNVQMVLGSIVLIVFALSALSRWFPEVAWLQPFRNLQPNFSEEQKAKMRRRANVHAGVELILVGMGLPLGYLALTVMMFNDITPLTTTLVLAGSVLCIGLGVTAIVRRKR
jgi:hypothetical protein